MADSAIEIIPEVKTSAFSVDDVEVSEYIDQEIVLKLDKLENSSALYIKYSQIYAGGVCALREKFRRENPDWMSQSANSFREIFYLLTHNNKVELQKLLNRYLGRSFTKKELEKYKNYINNLYSFFSECYSPFFKTGKRGISDK